MLSLSAFVSVVNGAATSSKGEGVPVPVVDEEFTPPLPPPEVGLGFIEAFVKSIAVIVVTELGDKTFFIAAVRFRFDSESV
jgi:hypothetical protein